MNAIADTAQDRDSRTIFGFWVYLMTDCIVFATLFATFMVLRNNTFGGPSGRELFNMPYVLAETMILLTSSFTCGLGILAAYKHDKKATINWFMLTAILGLSFLALELNEFHRLVIEGNSWRRSGFLTAFFTLVGTHGLHITAGLTWMAIMLVKITKKGLTPVNFRRLFSLSLFWHFLDIVWIFIFTIVFLIGHIQ